MEREIREDYVNCDVLIPVVLKAEKLACLIHLSTLKGETREQDVINATMYVVGEHHQESTDEVKQIELTPDNAFELHSDQSSANFIVHLSEYVYELVDELKLPKVSDDNIRGEKVTIEGLEKESDLLISLCSIAERLTF